MPPTTSTLAFFSSSASSFQPAPYIPPSSSQSSSSRLSRSTNRPHGSLAVPPLSMDPQPGDPGVVFINPPFTNFPESHLYPEGLTYSILAKNPEWFVDANDFVSQNNTNPNAITYPPQLEPPRGWCEASKQELKARGGKAHAEGESATLRCTFCRRTYSGNNAKSMWRRHVFEKHKIAMANRRDGNTDRPRGRGSGKENRKPISSRARDEAHDSIVSIVVAPQTVPENASHKSRFRTRKPIDVPRRRQERIRDKESINVPLLKESPLIKEGRREKLSRPSFDEDTVQAGSPPITPDADILSDTTPGHASHSDGVAVHSPVSRPIIPESPYNPLQTPSFRHCPPRLPSDQPWRYPSPSHPLHSNTRDLSLTIVAQPLPSPRTMLALPSSPLLSTPLRSSLNGFETPARSMVLGAKSNSKPFHSYLTSPLGTINRTEHCLGSSPLRKQFLTPQRHTRKPSEQSETWFSEGSLDHTPTPLVSTSHDPFTMYDTWVNDTHTSPAKAGSEPNSPVLRCGSLTSSTGLGLGLLESLIYSSDETLDTDLQEILDSPKLKKSLSEGKRSAIFAEPNPVDNSPPLKKRRLSQDTTTNI